ncbi:MAG: tRNA (guanine(10)-N(2))-dimethyltransferase [Candidatus Altiarchaeales archaeon IMC4]|nr:MAG: tRNA (guanine(10)-N(2))-dimethyltransferase [Candidatus Altiarchaeales archaeon IMC4]
MKLTEITEGRTKLFVPKEEKLLKSNEVFYNPEMELSRDISVAITNVLEPETFCDLLAGSGARGVRIANETNARVTINDLNPKACELARENLNRNGVSADVRNSGANLLLAGARFDYIDIDPFGPPVRFLDSAVRAVNSGGLLAVTATDTGALCGTYLSACQRKYDAVPLRTDYYNELGLRVLIASVARTAMRFGFGIKPLFSHCSAHYFRTYVQVLGRSANVKGTLENIGYLQHCFGCMGRKYAKLGEIESVCSCGERFRNAGPVWRGGFAEEDFCAKMKEELESGTFGKKKKALKLAGLVEKEQTANLPFYDVHKACKKLGASSTSMDGILTGLKSGGFEAERTHFSGVGVRTDAGIDELKKVIRIRK